jgi:hypothetical protein
MKRRNFIRNAALGGLAFTDMKNVFSATGEASESRVSNPARLIPESASGFKALHVEKTQSAIIVKGGTFEYALSLQSGLITSAVVMGDEWLAGPLPDLWASCEIDPFTKQFFAHYTPSATVLVKESFADRAVVTSHGQFALTDKTTIPLNYDLLYTFEIDGTVRVDIKITATKNLEVRWLTLVESRISKACCFVSHEYDVSKGPMTCSPTDYDVFGQKEINTGGKFIPWFHFGNDRSGLELVFPYSDNRQACYTDTSPYPDGDPLGGAGDLFTLKREDTGLLCRSYLIRNLREVIKPGNSFEDTFYISALPGRTMRHETNSLQIQWIGPHQYENKWQHPGEEEIRAWAAGGVNTVVGGANWYSGNYSNCSMAQETKEFLNRCHKYGLRVIPYITFTDQEYGTPGFDETGPKWRIEPVTEFNYRSQLMCYGSEGWQDHWQKEISKIFDTFPFDGLYIDFWAGKVICYNADHGCTGPHGRFTIDGLRKMARIARGVVDTKTEHGIILANTNILPLAMINNWMDARLYGEWHNLEQTDPLALRIYYNAHRYGTGNVLLINQVPKITERILALSALFQGNPVINHARTPEERSILERNALLLNAFGTNQSIAFNKFEMDKAIPSQKESVVPGVSAYYRPDTGALLVCFSSFAQSASTIQLGFILKGIIAEILKQLNLTDSVAKGSSFYLYTFENKDLIGGRPLTFEQMNNFTLDLPAESLRSIWIKPAVDGPSVLYALSNGDQPSAIFSSKENELVATIPSRARITAETVVLGTVPKTVGIPDGEVSITAHKGWWEGELPCNKTIIAKY